MKSMNFELVQKIAAVLDGSFRLARDPDNGNENLELKQQQLRDAAMNIGRRVALKYGQLSQRRQRDEEGDNESLQKNNNNEETITTTTNIVDDDFLKEHPILCSIAFATLIENKFLRDSDAEKNKYVISLPNFSKPNSTAAEVQLNGHFLALDECDSSILRSIEQMTAAPDINTPPDFDLRAFATSIHSKISSLDPKPIFRSLLPVSTTSTPATNNNNNTFINTNNSNNNKNNNNSNNEEKISVKDLIWRFWRTKHSGRSFFNSFHAAGVCMAMNINSEDYVNGRWIKLPGDRLVRLRLDKVNTTIANNNNNNNNNDNNSNNNDDNNNNNNKQGKVKLIVGPSGDGKTTAAQLEAATWPSAAEIDNANNNNNNNFGPCIFLDISNNFFQNPKTNPVYKKMEDWNVDPFKAKRNALCALTLIQAIFLLFAQHDIDDKDWPNAEEYSNRQNKVTDFLSQLSPLIPRLVKGILGCEVLNAATTNTDGFARYNGKLHIVIDEVGSTPAFIRGILAVWAEVRHWFATKIFNMIPENLLLVLAGTGSEYIESTAAGSFPERYDVFTVDPRPLFLSSVLRIPGSNQNFSARLLRALGAKLFESVTAAAFAALAEPEQKEIFEVTPPASTTSMKCRPRRNLDTFGFRFAQMILFSGRCASLAVDLAPNFSISNDNKTNNSDFNDEEIRKFLGNWADRIANEFIDRNGLAKLGDAAWEKIQHALRIVMSRRTKLADEEWKDMCVRYGLLRDTARHDNPTPPFRFRMSPAIIAMYLLQYKFHACTAVGYDQPTMFERVTAEHCRCVLSLNFFSKDNMPSEQEIESMPETIRLFRDVALKKPPSYRNFENRNEAISDDNFKRFSDFFAEQKQVKTNIAEHLWTWRTRIVQGGAVVVVNGPQAPFADVIVLTTNRIFLIQCKYYLSGSKVNCNEEFWKMHGYGEKPKGININNINTRRELISLCRPEFNDETDVHIECVILFVSKKNASSLNCRSNVESEEGFVFSEHIMEVLPRGISPSMSEESNLFPVMIAPMITSLTETPNNLAMLRQQHFQ